MQFDPRIPNPFGGERRVGVGDLSAAREFGQDDGSGQPRAIDLRLFPNGEDPSVRSEPPVQDLEVAARGQERRVPIKGGLMNRADLVICAGLNEGVWPARGATDALLAPPVLRTLGVPGSDYRIGLSAHDLAGALGAPEVVLSRAERDEGGPAIPSRFLLRVQALLGDLLPRHVETRAVDLARAIARAPRAPIYPRPRPRPDADQRKVAISATALDRLLGDPYQFYAGQIMGLRDLDALDADPTPSWQGTVAHTILQRWHEQRETGADPDIATIMTAVLDEENADPLTRGLWQPRLLAALVADDAGVQAPVVLRVLRVLVGVGRQPDFIERMARLVFRPLLFLSLHRLGRPLCVGSGDCLFGSRFRHGLNRLPLIGTGDRLWFRARHAARDGCP